MEGLQRLFLVEPHVAVDIFRVSLEGINLSRYYHHLDQPRLSFELQQAQCLRLGTGVLLMVSRSQLGFATSRNIITPAIASSIASLSPPKALLLSRSTGIGCRTSFSLEPSKKAWPSCPSRFSWSMIRQVAGSAEKLINDSQAPSASLQEI